MRHSIEARIKRLRELKAGFEQESKCANGNVGAMWQYAEKCDYGTALSGIIVQIDAAIVVLERVQRGETRPLTEAETQGGAYPPPINWPAELRLHQAEPPPAANSTPRRRRR